MEESACTYFMTRFATMQLGYLALECIGMERTGLVENFWCTALIAVTCWLALDVSWATLFWGITQRIVAIYYRRLGKPISPIFRGQECQTNDGTNRNAFLIYLVAEVQCQASGVVFWSKRIDDALKELFRKNHAVSLDWKFSCWFLHNILMTEAKFFEVCLYVLGILILWFWSGWKKYRHFGNFTSLTFTLRP
jgi:hypothetical protein